MRWLLMTLSFFFLPIAASSDVPTRIGLFSIGEVASGSQVEVEFEGLSGYVEIVSDQNGRVSHIVFYHDDVDALEQLVAKFTTSLGQPTLHEESEWVLSYSWPSQDGLRNLILTTANPCCGGETQTVAVLETTDPQRLCGHEDGFSEWLQNLQFAIATNDTLAVTAAFSYPFVRWELLHDPGSEIDRNQQINFRNQEEMLAEIDTNEGLPAILISVEDLDSTSPGCSVIAPEGEWPGYSTYATGIGGVSFDRTESGWKIDQTFYVPRKCSSWKAVNEMDCVWLCPDVGKAP